MVLVNSIKMNIAVPDQNMYPLAETGSHVLIAKLHFSVIKVSAKCQVSNICSGMWFFTMVSDSVHGRHSQ